MFPCIAVGYRETFFFIRFFVLEFFMSRRIDSFDSGSNYQFGDKMIAPNFPRSLFDLSHTLVTTIPEEGALIPIACIETLPTDSFDISVKSLIRVLPQVVPLYSKQRLSITAFYYSMGKLTSIFDAFIRRGYSGDYIGRIPSLNENFYGWSGPPDPAFHCTPYLGAPIGVDTNLFFSNTVGTIPFMYYKIWRDFYCNRNFYINDRNLFPDVDCEFRLDANGKIGSVEVNPGTVGKTYRNLHCLVYRDFPDDRFTSALPFPQRGTAPTLQLSLSELNNFILNTTAFTSSGDMPSSMFMYASSGAYPVGTVGSSEAPTFSLADATAASDAQTSFNTRFDANVSTLMTGATIGGNAAFSAVSAGVTVESLRRLYVAQTELERMARTDGSWAEFGLTFFGRASKDAVDYRGTYIGGTSQSLVFTEVVQTSAPTASGQSPLGTYAGHGISSGSDYLGHVECDDYGYIMILASIMPDVYYSQGLAPMLTRFTQDEYYLPTRAKLGLVPILRKELMFIGSSAWDSTLFAYQNPFDEYRYIHSRIAGEIADPSNTDFFAYTQSRLFNTAGRQPVYSQSFATTENNIRDEYLAAPSVAHYTGSFAFNIRAVRPLPYKPIPAELI
ncbi:major capsid protein [Tortoise microvirus 67]|nr:major capsid protein [Tortoise microvirus 67]